MLFARQKLPALCLALLLAGLVAVPLRLCPAQPAPASTAVPAAPASTAPAAQPASTQAYTLPPDKLAKAITLSRIRNVLGLVGSVLGIAVYWLLLATRAAAGLAAWAERVFRRRWMQGLLFFAALIFTVDLAYLPLSLFGHHVSLSYGISVQGWGSWLTDRAKAFGIALAGTPVFLLFNWLVRVSPRRFWIWIWLVSLPLTILTAAGAPLLAPIFNKFEPLTKSNPALVAKLETVVARTGTSIPPERMFLMKASAKTTGLNAYVTGLGATKRIVVWDTTAGRIPDDEVLFIFGHESGHYVLNHIPKGIAITAVSTFFVFWACAAFAGWLARRFGARWGLEPTDTGKAAVQHAEKLDSEGDGGFNPRVRPIESTQALAAEERSLPVPPDFPNPSAASAARNLPQNPLASRQGFVVLLFVLSLVGLLGQPAGNAISRHFEHEADIYGQEAIHGLVADPQRTAVSAFNHLGEAWLEDPNPSPLIEFWEYDHPSVQTRANFALHYNPWANGGRGRFFGK
jgi:Zn-dependent protease with chaperone function